MNTNSETWKPVVGYEGLYEVSNQGRVRSLGRVKSYYNGRWSVWTQITMKPKTLKQKERGGYFFVTLIDNNSKRKEWGVHRLVAMSFAPGYEFGLDVNHKDENKKNNFASNLEWCTRLYNNTYGGRLKRVANKLSRGCVQYDMDGNFVAKYDTPREAQDKTGVYFTSIKNCCQGRTKTAGGFKWSFAK